MSKIDKHFVSGIDKTLAQFDIAHAKSPAQQMEYDQYQRIYQLRDTPTESVSSELHSKFIIEW